eukprot:COSAG02_NODE_63429_length_263_cov_0.634146_1_plen_78_part_10
MDSTSTGAWSQDTRRSGAGSNGLTEHARQCQQYVLAIQTLITLTTTCLAMKHVLAVQATYKYRHVGGLVLHRHEVVTQ